MGEHLGPVNPKLNATDDFQPFQDTLILWRWLGLHCACIPFLCVIAARLTLSQGSCVAFPHLALDEHVRAFGAC